MYNCQISQKADIDNQAISLAYQAQQCISLIEDPLWKHVCTELMNMMGPFSVLVLWDSQITFSFPATQGISISCQHQESADLIQQYDFLIIEILRKYFSTLSEVKVEVST